MSFKHSDGDVINWEIKAYRLDGQEKSLAQFSTFWFHGRWLLVLLMQIWHEEQNVKNCMKWVKNNSGMFHVMIMFDNITLSSHISLTL